MMAACSALQCEGGSQMAIVIKTLSEQIYEYVFREIRIGHLKYGDKIDENELIERLGVSRTPIREALIQLASDNLLDNLSRKGFYVRHISDKEMDDAFDVIARLDTYVIELIMDKVDEETLSQLESCTVNIDKAISKHDYEEYYNWQEAFHLTYISKCGNDVLIHELKSLFKRSLRMTYYTPDEDELFKLLQVANDQHKQLLEAIRERDVERAKEISVNHWTKDIQVEE